MMPATFAFCAVPPDGSIDVDLVRETRAAAVAAASLASRGGGWRLAEIEMWPKAAAPAPDGKVTTAFCAVQRSGAIAVDLLRRSHASAQHAAKMARGGEAWTLLAAVGWQVVEVVMWPRGATPGQPEVPARVPPRPLASVHARTTARTHAGAPPVGADFRRAVVTFGEER